MAYPDGHTYAESVEFIKRSTFLYTFTQNAGKRPIAAIESAENEKALPQKATAEIVSMTDMSRRPFTR